MEAVRKQNTVKRIEADQTKQSYYKDDKDLVVWSTTECLGKCDAGGEPSQIRPPQYTYEVVVSLLHATMV